MYIYIYIYIRHVFIRNKVHQLVYFNSHKIIYIKINLGNCNGAKYGFLKSKCNILIFTLNIKNGESFLMYSYIKLQYYKTLQFSISFGLTSERKCVFTSFHSDSKSD